jgi:Cdc6-like AAA superfamily ATPase
MSTRTVNLIYTFILERFYGGKPRREMKASEGLQQHLRAGMGNEERTKIVVLDEIDHVINEHNFLYNMLEWLTVGAKLILILISNVIDLTIKLDSKLQSRWKFERIIFQPYSHPQIEQIIYHKYRDIRNLCRRDTVSYIAKRIFNINSDIRTLDKTYSRILTQFAEGGRRLLDIDAVKGLIYEENKAPTMQGSYAVIIRVLHKAEKRTEVSR